MKHEKKITGIVFDTQRFSVNDGPGIRTLIFLKGCPLTCEWCSNPESQKRHPQMGFYLEKCSGCQACVQVCPFGEYFALSGDINWSSCKNCLACVDACLYEARIAYGKEMTVQEVIDVIIRDKAFYESSNGGMTLGGGEATFQPEFAESILRESKAQGIHTALETCGFTNFEAFDRIIRHVDLLLFDIKHMASKVHREKTGVPNEVILRNAENAAKHAQEMIIRYPLIPGFNDDAANQHAMGEFIANSLEGVNRIDILPYHSMGESKMNAIGGAYQYCNEDEVPQEKLDEAKKILSSYGLSVSIGG